MSEINHIPLKNRLDNSHRGEEKRLKRIIEAYQKLQGKYKPFANGEPEKHYWNEEHFRLHKSSLFRQASSAQQSLILDKCSQNLIREAYFVEKSAFAYCGKMMLLAETTEIAQVYSMIANEEAIHLEWITPYIDIAQRHQPQGDFFKFISHLIEECDCNLLPYLVQVILEGWGLQHYKTLARGCQDARLKGVFLDIARDEALHHHTGEVVFNAQKTSPTQFTCIEESLKFFCHMAKAAPCDLLNVIDEIMGGICQADRNLFLQEIGAAEQSVQKLAHLKKLMMQPGVTSIVQKIDQEGYFSI